jgi:phosphoadenosine phosphosulfate reductase
MISWGKDSVVLLHLMILAGVSRFPVVYMRFGSRDNPDCEKVKDAFIKTYPLFNYCEDYFNYENVRKTGAHWKALAKKYGDYRVTGIRKDESGKRQLQWRLSGFESEHSCRPLSVWTVDEIFAYINQNNLPLCPVYGYLGGGRWKRENIRTHSLAGSSGNGMGREEWEHEYYPEILAKIKKDSFKGAGTDARTETDGR